MKELIYSLLLAILPVISYFLQEYFSWKNNQISLFRKHYTIRYCDWLFIFFNFLFVYSVSFNQKSIFLSLLASMIIIAISHALWADMSKKGNAGHFYYKNSAKITFAGIVHFVFMFIEASMIIIFLLSPKINSFYYIGAAILLLFAGSSIYGSYKIHKKIQKSDLTAGLFLIFLIFIKLVIITR